MTERERSSEGAVMQAQEPSLPYDEYLWSEWADRAGERRDVGARMVAKGQQWRAAVDAGDHDHADTLWCERDVLSREYDIADARTGVAWARYVVARHQLNEADIFG